MKKLVKTNTGRKDSIKAYACDCYCACFGNSSMKATNSVTIAYNHATK